MTTFAEFLIEQSRPRIKVQVWQRHCDVDVRWIGSLTIGAVTVHVESEKRGDTGKATFAVDGQAPFVYPEYMSTRGANAFAVQMAVLP